MNPTRIWKHISDHGARYEFAIETARGLFVGVADSRFFHGPGYGIDWAREALPGLVDIWHAVPRWMSPGEVLRMIEA